MVQRMTLKKRLILCGLAGLLAVIGNITYYEYTRYREYKVPVTEKVSNGVKKTISKLKKSIHKKENK